VAERVSAEPASSHSFSNPPVSQFVNKTKHKMLLLTLHVYRRMA